MSNSKKTTKKQAPKNPLHPIYEVEKFIGENGEIIKPMYILGEPRDYRLNMGTGMLTLSNGQQITKPKESFKVIPVAIRALEGKLFVKSELREVTAPRKWMEVYFINEKGNLSLFMFHGFSYENLSIASKDLIYDGNKLTETVWTITLESKQNKQKQNFFIADFQFEAIEEDDLATLNAVRENILDEHYHIYREGTKFIKTLYHENWSNGTVKTKKQLADESKQQKALEAEFMTKEELELKDREAIKVEAQPAAAA